jgi:NAD(P)-dependent dehydrogenase (short-subunit alcohol dehydrogenase family)
MDTQIKTVLITGAGKGIGFETVKAFLNDPLYQVIATSRNTTLLEQINHPCLHIVQGDLIDHYQEVLNQVLEISGHMHIIINNAAAILNKAIVETTNEEIDRVMQTNFTVPYKLIRDVSKILAPGAHIVNISSMSGFQGSKKFKGLSVYSASKAALAALSECVAEEWRDRNIACNCLALGAVDTEMIRISIPGINPEVKAEQMATYICEFAKTGHLLCNGQVLPVTLVTI